MADTSTAFYQKAPPDRGASSFIYPPTSSNLAFFAEALKAGCVVAIPTETVYGLAALALEPAFCRSIFAIKGRPLMDPLIVHVSGIGMAARLARLPEAIDPLAEAFWPGPLTLILKKHPSVPDLVTAGKDTVAIRMPRHPVAAALIARLDAPLAAPSANPFGYVSPSRPEHVADSFGDTVPFIIDGGPCEIGLESTILDLSLPDTPVILRPGAISREQIAQVLNCPVSIRHEVVKESEAASAPGTMARHYSPSSPLHLFEHPAPEASGNAAIVFLKRPRDLSAESGNCFWFSETGDPAEIGRSLFALLRTLDAKGFAAIHCQIPASSADGLLLAIRDRLIRAATK